MTSEGIVARAEMLIRSPINKVFEAFVDPVITSKFWFSRGSAKLVAGESVRWDWEMYGFSTEAMVKALEPNKRILVEWSAYGTPTDIEWVFTAAPMARPSWPLPSQVSPAVRTRSRSWR